MAVQTEGPRVKHPSAGRPLDAVATGLMIILCLSWGLNQVAVKLALPDVPPLTQGALRSFAALPVVFATAWLRGVRLTARDGTLVAGLTAGALFHLHLSRPRLDHREPCRRVRLHRADLHCARSADFSP